LFDQAPLVQLAHADASRANGPEVDALVSAEESAGRKMVLLESMPICLIKGGTANFINAIAR
jgi:hypothetical protein